MLVAQPKDPDENIFKSQLIWVQCWWPNSRTWWNFESNVGGPTLKLDPMLVAQPKDLDENMLKSNIGGPILGLDENKIWFWFISKGPRWNWVWNLD